MEQDGALVALALAAFSVPWNAPAIAELEMPGLTLTFAQAERLWGLEQDLCRQVINVLIGAEFLRCTPAGMIARADA